jgi:predicted O-linked N-acetylglucosamine transferase (SPINDLY family)
MGSIHLDSSFTLAMSTSLDVRQLRAQFNLPVDGLILASLGNSITANWLSHTTALLKTLSRVPNSFLLLSTLTTTLPEDVDAEVCHFCSRFIEISTNGPFSIF